MTMWINVKAPEGSMGDNEVRADEVRLALVRAVVYPSAPLEDDAGLAVLEARQRLTLPGLIDRLTRTDLTAVYNVVELLAFNLRDDAVFEAVAQQDAWIREILGKDGDERPVEKYLEANCGTIPENSE